MVCQKRKPQIGGWFLSVLHILGPVNGSHELTAALYDITRGAECWVMNAECWVLSVECWVLSTEFWVVSVECWVLSAKRWVLSAEWWLLQSTDVLGYHVFLLQMVWQKRKQQIDGWFLSMLHILGPVNRSHKLTASLYDYTRGAECWVMNAECWVLSVECWVLSA